MNGAMDEADINGTTANVSRSSPIQNQRKQSASRGRKGAQSEPSPNFSEHNQHNQPVQSKFIRELSTDALRSAFHQMHMEEGGSTREDGKPFKTTANSY